MSELKKLEQALAALEAQRHILGDDVVDAALAPMQEKIASLQALEKAADPRLKLVTVLFTDVTGSTQISQRLDPEDMLEVMDGAMQRLGLIVEQYGGRVIKYMGDGLMALFGDAVTREDDAEQAVRAGLEILREAKSYGQGVERNFFGTGQQNARHVFQGRDSTAHGKRDVDALGYLVHHFNVDRAPLRGCGDIIEDQFIASLLVVLGGKLYGVAQYDIILEFDALGHLLIADVQAGYNSFR